MLEVICTIKEAGKEERSGGQQLQTAVRDCVKGRKGQKEPQTTGQFCPIRVYGGIPPPSPQAQYQRDFAKASQLPQGSTYPSAGPGTLQPRTCSRVVSVTSMRRGSSGAHTVIRSEARSRRHQKSTRTPRAPRLSLPDTNTASQASDTCGRAEGRGWA